MAFTQITSTNLADDAITGITATANSANLTAASASSYANSAFIVANTVSSYANAAFIQANTAITTVPKISTVNVANSSYTILDDTAVNVGGGYIVITGSGFTSGAQVIIDTSTATSVSFIDSTTLRAQVPAKTAATYNLFVVNPDGGTAIRVNGLTYSGTPTWVTTSPLSNQPANVAFNLTFNATGATSYSVTAGSTLPAGTTLLANGYWYGTITVGTQTDYTFSLDATDAENQEAAKSFTVTVTVTPTYQLWTWGGTYTGSTSGQLGLNDTVMRSSPVQVGSGTTWSNVSTGQSSTMAIKTDGTLWVWGNNSYGELGLNDKVLRSSPVQVGSATTWSKISSGRLNMAAIKTDGTLWTWGYNNYGGLGLNDRVDRSSPVQVGSGTTWKLVNNSHYTMMVSKTDGTLWIWGNNNSGQLGSNNIINRSSPVQLDSGTTWNLFSTSGYQTVATKTNGTLWSWGTNLGGNQGQNDTVMRSSPVQVGSGTTWNKVSVGPYCVLATKTDGTLWSWGNNANGQLGQNSTVYRSSPVQVGSDTTWSNINISFSRHAVATKTNGTLWTWGWNNSGELGLNDRVQKNSPVQIGSGTTWTLVSTGSYFTMAIKQV